MAVTIIAIFCINFDQHNCESIPGSFGFPNFQLVYHIKNTHRHTHTYAYTQFKWYCHVLMSIIRYATVIIQQLLPKLLKAKFYVKIHSKAVLPYAAHGEIYIYHVLVCCCHKISK